MEDTYIIDLFWRRDENAIQLVDKKYNSTCYSIAWKILMNWEDSEECVNDTWCAAWRDMHIANITEEVESLNTARTHILDEHMEAEELIEIINRFLGGLSDRDRDILSRDIG